MTRRYHVVLIEDDIILQKMLTNALRQHEFNVTPFSDGELALTFLHNQQQSEYGRVHLVVSDVVLPDTSGVEIMKQIAGLEPLGKVLISVRADDQDKISGLLAGADDYVAKPVNPDELILRLRGLIKRLAFSDDSDGIIRFLHYGLHAETNELSGPFGTTMLGEAELELLLALIGQRGKHVTRTHLVRTLGNEYSQGRALDMLVSRLRRKLGDSQPPRILITKRGSGFLLADSL